ncbi:MAG: SdiA-regulated domain-containing protein [Phaeodactylibacter sp.]|nr:SdiA-regulated domain-containing protein [Phaeodactylibacter sp.]
MSIRKATLLFNLILAAVACLPAEKPAQKEGKRAQLNPSSPSGPDSGGDTAPVNPDKYLFRYELREAGSALKLSRELREVSALGLSADGAHLLAVNDEQGKVFFLDKQRGRILEELPFGPPGDYEGVEMVNHNIYIARSDGVIYEVEYSGKPNPVAKPHHTALNAEYDVEGLAYDPVNRRLLLACKGIAGQGPEFEDKRAVYAFSLDSMRLSDAPVYLLSEDMPVAEEAIWEAWWPDVLAGQFAPSGIAVHPITGHIYILSSRGKARAVLVMSAAGELLCIRELDKNPFNQPEGICFEPDGTMYISTEAKGKRGSGRVFRFRML